MITDGTSNWHYLAVKRIKSNHNGDFLCLNCFHSYTTERKLRKNERICENNDFCYPKMPDEDNKILKYIPGKRSLKVPFIAFADLECLLRKINTCRTNLKNQIQKRKLCIDLQTIL